MLTKCLVVFKSNLSKVARNNIFDGHCVNLRSLAISIVITS